MKKFTSSERIGLLLMTLIVAVAALALSLKRAPREARSDISELQDTSVTSVTPDTTAAIDSSPTPKSEPRHHLDEVF